MKNLFILVLLFSFIQPCFSWDGYDWQKGNYVQIGKGNLVRQGREIELYDYSDGKYKIYEVSSMRSTSGGRHTELELYDWRSGEFRTVEMDNY